MVAGGAPMKGRPLSGTQMAHIHGVGATVSSKRAGSHWLTGLAAL